MAAESADRAAAYGAGAAEQDSWMCSGYTPAFGCRPRRCIVGQPWPGEIAVEDVAARHAKLGFDIEWRHHLDAWFAATVESEAGRQRLGEHCLQGPQRGVFGLLP